MSRENQWIGSKVIAGTHTHTHTRTHARTHVRTHARTHPPTHTHTHTHTLKKKSKRKEKRDRQGIRGEGSEGKTPGVLVQRNADNTESTTYADLLKVVKQKASSEEVGSKVGHIRETKKGDC